MRNKLLLTIMLLVMLADLSSCSMHYVSPRPYVWHPVYRTHRHWGAAGHSNARHQFWGHHRYGPRPHSYRGHFR